MLLAAKFCQNTGTYTQGLSMRYMNKGDPPSKSMWYETANFFSPHLLRTLGPPAASKPLQRFEIYSDIKPLTSQWLQPTSAHCFFTVESWMCWIQPIGHNLTSTSSKEIKWSFKTIKHDHFWVPIRHKTAWQPRSTGLCLIQKVHETTSVINVLSPLVGWPGRYRTIISRQ